MTAVSKIKISSNRSFGLVFFVVFLIIALWPLKNGEDISSHTASNTYKTLGEILGIDFKTFFDFNQSDFLKLYQDSFKGIL